MSQDVSTPALRPVQPEALAHIARRLQRAREAPWLHGEVARRMADRLALIRLQPDRVIDWWSFTGASPDLLRRAYPAAKVSCVEDAAPQQRRNGNAGLPWWSLRRWTGAAVTPGVAPDQVADDSAGLLWANMMLHWVADPQAVLQQWHRALKIGGFLMFSTLGPGSLLGLRQSYGRARWPAPHAAFVDMHDLGDMLVRAGFEDPVMDQEIITLTWPDAAALLHELRTLGGNADPERTRGLRTPRWRERLLAQLQSLSGDDGRLRLDFEVIYGHAFKPAPRPRIAEETTVALEDMRAMVRRPRGAGPTGGLR